MTPDASSPRPPFDPRPVVLEDEHVRLEPLGIDHADDLLAAGRDEDISAFTFRPAFADRDVVLDWIETTLVASAHGEQIPFAIIRRGPGGGEDDRAVGSTRYIDIRRDHRAIEIGYTWVGRAWQRTVVNTACKHLLLGHAFDELGAVRVQLKTDERNERSQRAMERIGATREGVLRNHMLLPDGFVRNSVIYSVVAEEWPAVRERLDRKLASSVGR